MRKRWLSWGWVIVMALALFWFWPKRESSSERDAAKAIGKPSARNPAPATAKPVTEASANPEGQPKGKPRLTKAEHDKWAQSVQTQMKVALAGNYGGEKSFYSEYRRYSTDFNATGYLPESEEISFKVGFIRTFNPLKSVGPTEGTSHPVSSLDELNQYLQEKARRNGQEPKPFKFADSAKGVRIEDAARYCQSECTASETGFEAIAVANLDDDPDLDVWLINDKKEMLHVHDDLAP
jgi:hypothetical protein